MEKFKLIGQKVKVTV